MQPTSPLRILTTCCWGRTYKKMVLGLGDPTPLYNFATCSNLILHLNWSKLLKIIGHVVKPVTSLIKEVIWVSNLGKAGAISDLLVHCELTSQRWRDRTFYSSTYNPACRSPRYGQDPRPCSQAMVSASTFFVGNANAARHLVIGQFHPQLFSSLGAISAMLPGSILNQASNRTTARAETRPCT